jgi:protein-L-isoaspartate(D-aspartate) O-methyltransferase
LVGPGKIYSIERHSELVNFAKKNLEKLGIKNVTVILGDGNLGLSKESPFDRIIITAACEKIPQTLFEQLSINGLLVAPVGEFTQSLVLLKKTSQDVVKIKNEPGYVFVPLLGKSDNE